MSDGNGNGARSADAASPLEVLQRITRASRTAPEGERCEMCGEAIAEEHSHLVNLASRGLLCSCRACYLLFTESGAAGGKYRAVPDRYLAIPELALSSSEWDALQIPVSVAFFFFNSSMGRIAAFYPSPAGATESLLALDSWERIVDANPVVRSLEPDVEALLVRTERGVTDCFVVPIDACYELVGLLRMRWRGFDGGQEAHDEMDAFFDRVRERSQVVSPGSGS